MTILNIPIVDLNHQLETYPHVQHNSLIDFLDACNLKNSLIDTKPFTSNTFPLNTLLAFHAEIVEIHEILSLEEESVVSQVILEEESVVSQVINSARDAILELYLNESDPNQSIDSISECLTASSQPWIFSQDNQISHSNILQTSDGDISRTIPARQINNDSNEVYNTKLDNELQPDDEAMFKIERDSDPEFIKSYSPSYIIYECTKCDFSFSPAVNIEKYEALNTAVHGQVCQKITLHNFKSSDTLEIELYPEKLGKIKIKCNVDNNDKIIFELSADKLTTLALLEANANDLRDVIAKSFQDSYNDKAELSFTMSDNSHKQDAEGYHEKQSLDNDLDKKQTVYFLHNGIINLIV